MSGKNRNGKLSSISGARQRVSDLKADFGKLRETVGSYVGEVNAQVNQIREALQSLSQTLRRLVDSNNASTMLLASVERYLDSKDPNWDGGYRAELEVRAGKVRERAGIKRDVVSVPEEMGEEERARRASLAKRLWELAGELGTTEEDGLTVIALHLQAGDALSARRVRTEYLELHPEPKPEVRAVLDKLDARADEVLAAETRIVIPDGSERLPLPPGR